MHNGEKFSKLSVTINVYNEEEIIEDQIAQITAMLDELVDAWEIVLCENGSTDNTANIIKSIMRKDSRVRMIRLKEGNIGLAILAGFKECKFDFAARFEIEFWDRRFLEIALNNIENFDLIVGVKIFRLDNRRILRRILTLLLNTALRNFLGMRTMDSRGMKVLYLPTMRNILDNVSVYRGMTDPEIVIRAERANLRIGQIPVPVQEIRQERKHLIKKLIFNFIDFVKLYINLRRVPSNFTGHITNLNRIN
ncbi:MAG: glycosyltransferase [Deltaproteobacteria bacterium]|nr:glycosyltransferase [Deltaproteobacteria bacterium]